MYSLESLDDTDILFRMLGSSSSGCNVAAKVRCEYQQMKDRVIFFEGIHWQWLKLPVFDKGQVNKDFGLQSLDGLLRRSKLSIVMV